MRAVIDTNVWVSGLIVPNSAPGRVLVAVRDGRIKAVASWALAEEIAEVLRRPKLARYAVTEIDVAEVVMLLGPLLPDVEVNPPLRDPDDAPVVAAALAGAANAIVTGDADLHKDGAMRDWLAERGVVVVSPSEMLTRLHA